MIVNIYFKLVTSALRPRGASHFIRQIEITLISKKRASCLRANNRRPSLFCYPQSNWSIRSNFAELLSELDWPPDIETWRSRSAATAILESIIADGGSIYRFKSYLYQYKKNEVPSITCKGWSQGRPYYWWTASRASALPCWTIDSVGKVSDQMPPARHDDRMVNW